MRERQVRLAVSVGSAWLGLAIGALGAAAQEPAPPPFGDVLDVHVVNVDVHVTDRSGRPVTGLRREDFEVFEDGKRVDVSNFEVIDRGATAAETAQTQERPESTAPPSAPGEPRRQAAVHPEDRLHLVVYIDNSFIVPAHRARVLQQLRSFLDELRPEDRVMMVTHDQDLTVRLPFTDERAAMEAALSTIGSLSSQGISIVSDRREALRQSLAIREAVRAIEGPCSRSIVVPIRSYAETTRQEVLRSIGAMTVLVNSLSGVPGRKALLQVSDGFPATPGEELFQFLAEICGGGATGGFADVHDAELLGPDSFKASEVMLDAQQYSTVPELQRLAAHANANRVTLYMLQASGLEGSASASAEFGVDERLLQIPAIQAVQIANLQNPLTMLASETGGRAILNANDIRSDLRRMKDELARYYSLGYVPAHSGDGKVHRIDVRIRRPGLQVRHRQSYRDKPAIERTVDRTLAAVYHGFEDNPLEIQLEVGEPKADQGDRFLVPFKLRIPLFRLGISTRQDQSYQGRLRLFVSTRDSRGGVSPIRQIDVPLQIPREQILYAMGQFYEYQLTLSLPRGEQRVAIGVRDEATTTTSVLSRTVTVR